MDKLRIGVIGVGGRGSLADNAHHPQEGVLLVAGAEQDSARKAHPMPHDPPAVVWHLAESQYGWHAPGCGSTHKAGHALHWQAENAVDDWRG